jgi:acetylornithine deacetylase
MTEIVRILKDLVAFNTVSDQPPVDAIAYLKGFLAPLGFSFLTEDAGGFESLVARNEAALAWRGDGRYLAFCAHIDTVPVDRSLWTTDPFALEERDGKCYGVGTSDMKGSLACMLASLGEVSRSRPDLPLALVVTHHEETALEGARALVRSRAARAALRPMQLIIGEPTGLSIGYAHKGVLDFTVTIEGRSSHSGTPHRGLNALYGATAILEAGARLDAEWRETRHPAFDSGNTVNVGTLRGGDVRNRVPGRAILSGDMRIVPGSSAALLVDEIEHQFSLLEVRGYACRLDRDFEASPFAMPADSGLIADLRRSTGAPLITLNYATDAAVFQGEAGLDCAIFGPGDIRVCHMPDEYIETRELANGAALYTKMLLAQRCAVAEEDPVDAVGADAWPLEEI